MEMDACFHCHQRGHWVKDCPFKTPDKKFEPSSSSSNDFDLPLIRCRCDQNYCLVRTSRTDKNPGRKFYTCPGVNGGKCGFFKWCDEVKNGETSKSPTTQSVYPRCSCGAGVCRRITLQGGPNAGRSYFVCPIEKGHGACLFHQWEGGSSIEHSERITFESLDMKSPQQPSPSFVALDGDFENEQEPLLESQGHDETFDVSNPAMEMDACFHCHQRGHWVKNCPFKTPDKKFEPSSSSSNDFNLPLIRCRCDQNYCLVRTSRTDKNPGRKFYTCPGVNGGKCGFFKWCDEVKNGGTSKSPTTQLVYPRCSCGAGVCRRITLQGGPNAGRSYFVCPIEKGHGACLFHQWEGDSSIEHSERMTFESLDMKSPQQPSPSSVALDGYLENEKEPLVESQGHDETFDVSNPAMEMDACFHCHQRGHWVKNCPFKTPDKKFEPSSSSSNDFNLPLIWCRCDQNYCLVQTSRTDKNPGRKFYTCPGVNGGKCGFFKWCDEVKNGGTSKSPTIQLVYPRCSCGAGVCQRITLQGGPNAGRSYFVCPIEKGHGACLFHQWEGTHEVIAINEFIEECKLDRFAKFTSKNLASGLGDLSIEHSERITLESPEMKNPQQQSPSCVALDGHFENEQEPLVESRGHDETFDVSNPAKYIDPSHVEAFSNLQDLVLLGAELRDPSVKKTLLMSHLTAWAEIHCRETEFWMQITTARDKSTQGYAGQILGGHHILGWWGRLAFPPSRCLPVPPTRHFLCCVLSTFDPIFVQRKNVFNNEGFNGLPHSLSITDFDKPSPQISGQDTPALINVSWEVSNPKSSPPIFEGNISTSHLEVFEQTLLYVQNQLITSLQSMDALNYESMTKAAQAIFDVLDQLSVDYRPLRERVRKFIDQASSLSEMEHSATNEHSLQELIEQYHSEKVRYEDICHNHAETVSSLTASSQCIQSLREKKASFVKDLLLRVGNQLSSCEAETRVLQTCAGEISRDILGSQKS